MRYEIKRIDIWPAVKISFFVGAVVGFLSGLVWSGFALLISSFVRAFMDESSAGVPAFLSAFVPFVLAPVQGVLWALFSAIGVSVYNLVARWAGGVTANLEAEELKVASTQLPDAESSSDVEPG